MRNIRSAIWCYVLVYLFIDNAVIIIRIGNETCLETKILNIVFPL